jgi:hypothetical protein
MKDVEFRGRKMRIMCHDLSSAYLPLLDVCNYFLLEKNYVLNLDDGIDSISRSDLVQEFVRIMNKEMDFGRHHPGVYEKPKDFEKFFFTLGGDPVDNFPDMFSRRLLGVSHIDPFNTKWYVRLYGWCCKCGVGFDVIILFAGRMISLLPCTARGFSSSNSHSITAG